MKKCNIIVKFTINDFDVLKYNIKLTDFNILTNEYEIKEKLNEIGCDAKWLQEEREFANDSYYHVYKEAVRETELIFNNTTPIKYKEINLMEGLKSDILFRLEFLENIKRNFDQQHNLLFLFSNFNYEMFAILEIAKTFGYDITFGIKSIVDDNLQSEEFSQSLAKNYDYLYNNHDELLLINTNKGIDEFVHSFFKKNSKFIQGKHVFFLTDNSYELYLKPIFPILEIFNKRKIPFVIFTLDQESTNNLQNRKFNVINLASELSNLIYLVLKPLQQLDSTSKQTTTRDVKKTVTEYILTIEEKIYFKIFNFYINHQKNPFVNKIAMIIKPHFQKIELDIKRRKIKQQKQVQLSEINRKRLIQKLKTNVSNVSDNDKQNIVQAINLFKKQIPITPQQKIINDTLLTIKEFDKNNNHTGSNLIKYFSNEINVLLIARAISAITLIDAILNNTKFLSILTSIGGNPDIDLIRSISKKHDIPSYMSTIWPYEEYIPINKIVFSGEKLLIAGNKLYQELIDIGIQKERLIITGNPKFDYLNNLVKKEKHVAKEIERKKIVVANTRWKVGDEDWMSRLIKFCNDNDLDILIKVHPVYENWKKDFHQERVSKINEKCKGLRYKIIINGDLSKILLDSTVLLTEFSWTGFESSLCNVPIIVTNFSKKEYSKYALLYNKEGVALYATSIEEVFICLKQILDDQKVQQKLSDARIKFHTNFNYLNDGNAAERIVDILVNQSKIEQKE
jgi:hypothetical protein